MKLAAYSILLCFISSVSALAADISSSRPTQIMQPVAQKWTGTYAGLNVGGTWSNNSTINTTTFPLNGSVVSPAQLTGSVPIPNSLGFIGGGQIGYNQLLFLSESSFIVGVEADIQGIANSSDAGKLYRVASYDRYGKSQRMSSDLSASTSIDYLGTVRGRLGYLLTPNLLVYGTGGFAYGDINLKLSNFQSYTDIPPLLSGIDSISQTQVGYSAGGGAEWMLSSNWSAKVEYLYYDLGHTSSSFINNLFYPDGRIRNYTTTQFSNRFDGNVIRVGVNYHFDLSRNSVINGK